MATEFQSSFIPKEPVTKDGFAKSQTSIFGIISLLLFLVVLAATGGLFAYKYVVKGEINSLQTELAQAESQIDKKEINEMAAFGKKLGMIKNLVSKHRAISSFIGSLASSTVSSVKFTEFTFGPFSSGTLLVTMNGETTGYAAVALQEKMFVANPHFKEAKFSDLNLTDRGMVTFKVVLTIDPKILEYTAPSTGVSTSTNVSLENGDLNPGDLGDLDFNLENI